MKCPILYLCLILTAFQISCNKSNDEEVQQDPVSSSDLIPLKIGNAWHYDWYLYYDGVQNDLSYSDDSIYTTQTAGGHTYYKVGSFNLRTVDSNTVEILHSEGTVRPFLKRVSIDSTIVYTDTLISFDNTIRRLVAYTGTFEENGYSCLKNELITTTMGETVEKFVYYVKPGIGIVKREFYYGDDIPVDRFYLKSYGLK